MASADTHNSDLVAQIGRNSWWAYYGPLPEAPYVRAVIEVVADSAHTEFGHPPRPVRNVYVFYREAMAGDADLENWQPIVEMFAEMTDDEFNRLVKLGVLVQLGDSGARTPTEAEDVTTQ
ncbi:MAG: hypothetical protein ABSG64_07675 [Solirubrobacteraceae bacterium]